MREVKLNSSASQEVLKDSLRKQLGTSGFSLNPSSRPRKNKFRLFNFPIVNASA